MLRCEIDKNIVTQMVDIYILDQEQYVKYMGDGVQEVRGRTIGIIGQVEPYISIRFDVWEKLSTAIAEDHNVRKGIKETSGDHVNDLRWVLTHFINKDKK